jgi:hypothetical protein
MARTVSASKHGVGSPTLTDATSLSQSRVSPAHRTVAPSVFNSHLNELAHCTKRKMQWRQILRGADPTATQWKWLENARNFSIYTKDDTTKQFAVLAIGVVKGSVPEIASLLVAKTQSEYVRKMEALYDKSFTHGMYVHDVVPNTTTPSVVDDDEQEQDEPMQLSVRTATFDRPGGWLMSKDEWAYLESTTYNRENQMLEKLMTSLTTQDTVSLSSAGRTKFCSDVTAGFRVEPDHYETTDVPPGMEDTREKHMKDTKSRVATRVHFYADYCAGSTSLRDSLRSKFGRIVGPKLKRNASAKAVRERLIFLARSCDRLSHLVRRRRLGMQLVVDQKRFLQITSSSCFCCEKRLGVITKVCRVCGQGVCSDCSAKYERETHSRRTQSGRVRLERIRVCDPCLVRVDHADYSSISDAALAGPGVQPNPHGAKPASSDLKDLLHDALLQAPSPSRKDAVLSVIRCVLDQERASDASTPPTTPSSLLLPVNEKQRDDSRASDRPRILLTPVSSDKDYVDALDFLEVPTVTHTQAELANEAGRPYVINSRVEDPDAHLPFPVPPNERERLDAIEHTRALGHGTYSELDIICDIAAKELGSFASLVSIITADEQRVVGANMDWLRELVIKREDAFCAHTIMDSRPLEVPHPESDIRFSKIVPVTTLGAKYYCGFPIVADDDYESVIGALCVIDTKANALTESQFAVLRKLAKTASKIVRLEGAKRRSTVVSAPSTMDAVNRSDAGAETTTL